MEQLFWKKSGVKRQFIRVPCACSKGPPWILLFWWMCSDLPLVNLPAKDKKITWTREVHSPLFHLSVRRTFGFCIQMALRVIWGCTALPSSILLWLCHPVSVSFPRPSGWQVAVVCGMNRIWILDCDIHIYLYPGTLLIPDGCGVRKKGMKEEWRGCPYSTPWGTVCKEWAVLNSVLTFYVSMENIDKDMQQVFLKVPWRIYSVEEQYVGNATNSPSMSKVHIKIAVADNDITESLKDLSV